MKSMDNDKTGGKWRERFKHAQASWLRVWGTKLLGGGAAGPAPPRIKIKGSTINRINFLRLNFF